MDGDMAVTQAAGTGRLPAEKDAFVGRATDLGQIDELLRDAPLLTLVGPGGVGKSRVALRVAATAAPRYPDGVYLSELSALRDPELLVHTVSRQLGLADQAAGSRRDALLAHLRERCLLLVLDNCEHLVDACANLVEAILADAPLVTVIATSREPLAVAGETIYQVGPLLVARADTGGEPPSFGASGFPGGDEFRGGAATAAGDGDAVELFARRAAAAAPGFTVTDANRADVIRICRGLDGIPLAIELAAGRLRDLGLAEVSSRLDRRLSLLTGGSDGNDARHATARDRAQCRRLEL
jgi:predicted ATPase